MVDFDSIPGNAYKGWVLKPCLAPRKEGDCCCLMARLSRLRVTWKTMICHDMSTVNQPFLRRFFPLSNWLVVWTPLKNMSSSVGMMTFPICEKIKHVPNHQRRKYFMFFCHQYLVSVAVRSFIYLPKNIHVLKKRVTSWALQYAGCPATRGPLKTRRSQGGLGSATKHW